MGAGITMAQGLNRVEPDAVNFAFIGDSTFFHTGITGVVNAVYNGANIIIAVLDNSTTAMTGNQPHPGMGRTISGTPAPKISIEAILKAVGVSDVQTVDAFDLHAAKKVARRAMDARGTKAIIFKGACVALSTATRQDFIDDEKCSGCGICVKKLGCPALSITVAKGVKKAVIDGALCTGCELCAKVCPFGAIEGGERSC
jgi:indolepyruvate ferredoxin oxidoreductase alpha subunit